MRHRPAQRPSLWQSSAALSRTPRFDCPGPLSGGSVAFHHVDRACQLRQELLAFMCLHQDNVVSLAHAQEQVDRGVSYAQRRDGIPFTLPIQEVDKDLIDPRRFRRLNRTHCFQECLWHTSSLPFRSGLSPSLLKSSGPAPPGQPRCSVALPVRCRGAREPMTSMPFLERPFDVYQEPLLGRARPAHDHSSQQGAHESSEAVLCRTP